MLRRAESGGQSAPAHSAPEEPDVDVTMEPQDKPKKKWLKVGFSIYHNHSKQIAEEVLAKKPLPPPVIPSPPIVPPVPGPDPETRPEYGPHSSTPFIARHR